MDNITLNRINAVFPNEVVYSPTKLSGRHVAAQACPLACSLADQVARTDHDEASYDGTVKQHGDMYQLSGKISL